MTDSNRGKEFVITNETFVNPYSFIPLEKNEPHRESYLEIKKESRLLTGRIKCTIENLTPIFIPDTSIEKIETLKNGDSLKVFEFFSYNNKKNPPGEPVIPGSEIRGMIRSAFETLTSSCLSTIDIDMKFFKRTAIPKKNFGQLKLENNEWNILECTKYSIEDNLSKQLNNGDTVFHRGEPFGDNRAEFVFKIKNDCKSIRIPEESVENLLENIRLYKKESINKHLGKGHSGYENIKVDKIDDLNDIFVYYSESGGYYYLSPAAIGREVFYNSFEDILRNSGFESHLPCKKIDNLCPACALFGIAGKDGSAASRIRFTDAKIAEESKKTNNSDYFNNQVILPELSSPKPSATEFYLKCPSEDADTWNYDYYIRWKRDGSNKAMGNIETSVLYNPEIRGRKFYWHNMIELAPSCSGDPSKRNVKVRPLGKNNKFAFYVYFNDIRESELKKILWVLEIGNIDSKAHKIGMGKPLGMGSVRIMTEPSEIRKIEMKGASISYNITTDGKYLQGSRGSDPKELMGCSSEIMNSFLQIADTNHNYTICYPCNVNGQYSYEWFGANKAAKGVPDKEGVQTSPVIVKVLPEINDPYLIKYKEINNESLSDTQPGVEGQEELKD